MADAVHISDLMMYARIGCTGEERAFPQRLLLSADFTLDLRKAGQSGNLKETICYATLSEEFANLAAETEWILLEQLSEQLAQHTLTSYSQVTKVAISVKKFAVPSTAHVGVSIERSR